MKRNDAIKYAIEALSTYFNGGKGSGNFGHGGRPGKVGGSSPSGGGAGKKPAAKPAAKTASKTSGGSVSGAAKTLAGLNKELAKAKSVQQAKPTIDKIREHIGSYLEANGGKLENWRQLEKSWWGNDYAVMEKAIKDGNHKELNLMRDLQQEYFKQQGIKEVTLHRGLYNSQAKKIKDQLKKGDVADLDGDYAVSFTEYQGAAEQYAGGAAFSAPDKITDSVVVTHTFKAKDVVYSTYISTFYAGNQGDEFVVSIPKGIKVKKKNIKVLK